MLIEIVAGIALGALLFVILLGLVRIIVGDPHMLRDMWECRLRPIKRWRKRR